MKDTPQSNRAVFDSGENNQNTQAYYIKNVLQHRAVTSHFKKTCLRKKWENLSFILRDGEIKQKFVK